jgi:hypothetical protein
MLMLGRQALGVALDARRIRDAELARQVLHHAGRHDDRVRQERSQEPHRRELHAEAQAIVVAVVPVNHSAVLVIQEEEPLKLGLGRRSGEASIPGDLLIGQELDPQPTLPAQGRRQDEQRSTSRKPTSDRG